MKAVVPSLVAAMSLAVACKDDALPEPPCNIADSDCQQAVFELTARVRGQSGADVPPIRVISRQRLRDEIQASLDAAEEPPADQVAIEQAFALLRLLPAGAGEAEEALADDLAEGIAAYYAPGSRSITIIADSADDEADGTYVLAHEFVHALQDQRGDLDMPSAFDTTDAQVSFDALVEGEAVWLSNLVMAEAAGTTLVPDEVEVYFAEMRDNVLATVAETDAPFYLAAEILPYPLGGRGVFHSYTAKKLPGIEALHGAPPDNLAFWLETGTTPAPLTCAAPSAPSGFTELVSDRVGVTGMVALDGALSGEAPTLALAQSWLDDSLKVYGDQSFKKLGLALRVRLAAAADATALETRVLDSSALASTLLYTEVNDAELLIVAANDQPLLDALIAGDPCGASMPAPTAPALPLRAHRRAALLR